MAEEIILANTGLLLVVLGLIVKNTVDTAILKKEFERHLSKRKD